MIPRDEFDRYDVALTTAARLARAAVEALLAGSPSPEELAAAYAELVRAYGSAAAAAAVELYRSLRASQAPPASYEAVIFEPDDAGLLAWDVANSPSLPDSSMQRVMGYADETLLRNADADPAHPRWALVPHAGACAWCRLMASQGFVYSSEASVARHPNCTCTPVVDFDARGPGLEGYDPGELYDEYRLARAEVEDAAREEWASMSPERRDAYKAKGRGAYDHFLRNRIVAAMARDGG